MKLFGYPQRRAWWTTINWVKLNPKS